MRNHKIISIKINRRFVTAAAVLFSLLTFCCIMGFIVSLRDTRRAMQQERASYANELASQITHIIENTKLEYTWELQNYASSLNYLSPRSFGDLQKIFSKNDTLRFILVSKDGKTTDISGHSVSIGNYLYIGSIAKNGISASFSTINDSNDYWLFGTPVTPLSIDGSQYVALILGVPSEYFRSTLSVSIFSGIGAAYLIAPNGAISVKPDSDNLLFNGYNLFLSMEKAGANVNDMDTLRINIATGKKGSMTTEIGGKTWLISYNSVDDLLNTIVVTIPLSVTAAFTYKSMAETIVFSCCIILLAGIMCIVILLYYFQQNREHEAQEAAIAAQNAFLSKMSHDIRTPLNSVIGLLTIAEEPEKSSEQILSSVHTARESADYLLELINSMLDVRNIEDGSITLAHEQFSPDSLISEINVITLPSALEKQIKFTVRITEQFSCSYYGDPARIKQILMNLISNSLKFTPSNGNVTLTASHAPIDDSHDMVTFTVEDNGTGMSKEFMSRLFRPFEQERSSYTSQYAGSGLGLNIVKNIATLMGGTVSVTSEQNQGSKFAISIPLLRGPQLEKTEPEAKKKQIEPFHGERILIAEDNQLNQQIAVMLLSEKLNLTVEAVSNGKEAVDKISGSAPGRYAAVLMDIQMPVMDGLEATRAIRHLGRKDTAELPIFALSANAFEQDIKASLASGMNGHLSKPINLSAISQVLHRVIL